MAITIQDLTARLQRSTIEEVEDHEEIIKTCNAILKKSKRDLETQHVKVVALLKCDRFEDAIRVIEEGGQPLKTKASLEWSYALYKVGKLDEAISAASAAASAGSRGAKHVEAQASYRAENFRRTSEIYDELCGRIGASDKEEVDLRINMRAADAQLQWARQKSSLDVKRASREDLEGFETTYNVACEHIARGELKQAQLLLKRAKELCNSSDLSSEDKETELMPISVQQVYVASQLGNLDEAASFVEEVSVDSITELSTKKIAQNNIVVSSHENSNPYQQHKLFNSTPKATGTDKLFSFQNRIIDWNSHVLDLLTHKSNGIERATSETLSQHSSSTTSPDINNLSVINVAAHCHDEQGKACLSKALPLLEKRPNDVGLVLTIVQLYVENKNVTSAVTVLESLLKRLEESVSESDQDIRYSPGLVSVLITLYKSQGRKHGIRAELLQAANHWQQRPDQASPLLRAAGSSLLHSSNPSDITKSGEIFSRLRELDPSDPVAAVGYVASYATLNPSAKVPPEVEELSSIQDLVAGIDITALEEAGVPALPAPTIATTTAAASRKRAAASADDGKQTIRKKRVRKSRLPKDYDPNKQPDPERWLPLRDRSTYRPPKGKKGKQKPPERMQGGIVSDESVPTQATVSQQKPQGGGGSSNKKKKGKGKR